MRAIPILVLAMLSACESAPPAPAPKPTPIVASEFQNQVAALTDAERNIVFIRAIRDAGLDCQGVTGATRQPDLPSGEQYYVAKCTDGTSYGVVLGRAGSAKILSRTN